MEEKNKKDVNDIYFENLNIFLRNGSIQDPNNSFLYACFSNYFDDIKNIDNILNNIISNLTPLLFIDLNCGDIFKYFLPTTQ